MGRGLVNQYNAKYFAQFLTSMHCPDQETTSFEDRTIRAGTVHSYIR